MDKQDYELKSIAIRLIQFKKLCKAEKNLRYRALFYDVLRHFPTVCAILRYITAPYDTLRHLEIGIKACIKIFFKNETVVFGR